jgi:hypothetical protein
VREEDKLYMSENEVHRKIFTYTNGRHYIIRNLTSYTAYQMPRRQSNQGGYDGVNMHLG